MDIFDKKWMANANKPENKDSWSPAVIEDLDTTGGIYLNTLRIWFSRFPGTDKQKKPLMKRLESFSNEDHLGGVNELSWWEFMQRTGLKATPVPTSATPQPDFRVETPSEYFVEVSTLNVSEKEKRNFRDKEAVNLNHFETLRRILLKITGEKKRQILFADSQRRPCALVIFDYTTWSAFGTHFFRYLADFLLGPSRGFTELPVELSTFVYVERKVINGRIGISRDRSAIYYNPNAQHPLSVGAFAELNEYWCQMTEVQSKSDDQWIWL